MPRPRIVVPFRPGWLKPETHKALEGLPATYVPMGAEWDYHNLIAGLWQAGQTFITIEQDIVPTPTQIDELITCPEPWCAHAYDYPPWIEPWAGMGCAKFSARLTQSEPRALETISEWFDAKHPPRHWCRLDEWLKTFLYQRGWRQHVHGVVRHLHAGHPAHNCVVA